MEGLEIELDDACALFGEPSDIGGKGGFRCGVAEELLKRTASIIAGGNSYDGAGLALAIYEVLYDSTGYGTYNTAGQGTFYVASGLSGAVETAYNSYLSVFNTGSSAANVSANLASGDVLRSTETGAGQDLIWNLTPVPEPTTILAGALLLLPFGFSAVRMLRKSR